MHLYVPFFLVSWGQVVYPDCEHPEWVKEEHEREDRRPLTWNHTEPVCDVFLESGPLLECLRTDYAPITDGCTQLEGPDFELCMYFHYEAFEKDCSRWQDQLSGKIKIVEPPDSVFHIVASLLVTPTTKVYDSGFWKSMGDAFRSIFSARWAVLAVLVFLTMSLVGTVAIMSSVIPRQTFSARSARILSVMLMPIVVGFLLVFTSVSLASCVDVFGLTFNSASREEDNVYTCPHRALALDLAGYRETDTAWTGINTFSEAIRTVEERMEFLLEKSTDFRGVLLSPWNVTREDPDRVGGIRIFQPGVDGTAESLAEDSSNKIFTTWKGYRGLPMNKILNGLDVWRRARLGDLPTPTANFEAATIDDSDRLPFNWAFGMLFKEKYFLMASDPRHGDKWRNTIDVSVQYDVDQCLLDTPAACMPYNFWSWRGAPVVKYDAGNVLKGPMHDEMAFAMEVLLSDGSWISRVESGSIPKPWPQFDVTGKQVAQDCSAPPPVFDSFAENTWDVTSREQNFVPLWERPYLFNPYACKFSGVAGQESYTNSLGYERATESKLPPVMEISNAIGRFLESKEAWMEGYSEWVISLKRKNNELRSLLNATMEFSTRIPSMYSSERFVNWGLWSMLLLSDLAVLLAVGLVVGTWVWGVFRILRNERELVQDDGDVRTTLLKNQRTVNRRLHWAIAVSGTFGVIFVFLSGLIIGMVGESSCEPPNNPNPDDGFISNVDAINRALQYIGEDWRQEFYDTCVVGDGKFIDLLKFEGPIKDHYDILAHELQFNASYGLTEEEAQTLDKEQYRNKWDVLEYDFSQLERMARNARRWFHDYGPGPMMMFGLWQHSSHSLDPRELCHKGLVNRRFRFVDQHEYGLPAAGFRHHMLIRMDREIVSSLRSSCQSRWPKGNWEALVLHNEPDELLLIPGVRDVLEHVAHFQETGRDTHVEIVQAGFDFRWGQKFYNYRLRCYNNSEQVAGKPRWDLHWRGTFPDFCGMRAMFMDFGTHGQFGARDISRDTFTMTNRWTENVAEAWRTRVVGFVSMRRFFPTQTDLSLDALDLAAYVAFGPAKFVEQSSEFWTRVFMWSQSKPDVPNIPVYRQFQWNTQYTPTDRNFLHLNHSIHMLYAGKALASSGRAHWPPVQLCPSNESDFFLDLPSGNRKLCSNRTAAFHEGACETVPKSLLQGLSTTFMGDMLYYKRYPDMNAWLFPRAYRDIWADIYDVEKLYFGEAKTIEHNGEIQDKPYFNCQGQAPDGNKCEVRNPHANNHLRLKEDVMLGLEWLETAAMWFNRSLSAEELVGIDLADMDCSGIFDVFKLSFNQEGICSYPGINAVTLWAFSIYFIGVMCGVCSVFFALLRCAITSSDWSDEEFSITMYFEECKRGHTRLVSHYLKHFVTEHVVDRFGNTGLHWAVLSNNPGLVHYLLERGLDPNQYNHQKYTPVHVAFIEQHLTTGSELLDHGGDPNLVDFYGERTMTGILTNPFIIRERMHKQETTVTAGKALLTTLHPALLVLERHGANLNFANTREEVPGSILEKLRGSLNVEGQLVQDDAIVVPDPADFDFLAEDEDSST